MKEIDARRKVYAALNSFDKYEIFRDINIYTPSEFKRLVGTYICDYINERRHNYNWDFKDKELLSEDKNLWTKFTINKKGSIIMSNYDITQTMRIIIDEPEKLREEIKDYERIS